MVKTTVSQNINQEVKITPGKVINNKNDQGTDIKEKKWPF